MHIVCCDVDMIVRSAWCNSDAIGIHMKKKSSLLLSCLALPCLYTMYAAVPEGMMRVEALTL